MKDIMVFNCCNMQRTSLVDSEFNLFHFKNCDLRWSNFTNSNLRGFKFINCDLRGVCFDFSDLTGADFSGSIIDSNTNFIGCKLMDVTGLDIDKICTGGDNIVPIKRKKHHSL